MVKKGELDFKGDACVGWQTLFQGCSGGGQRVFLSHRAPRMQDPEIIGSLDDGVGAAGIMARTRAVGALGARVGDRRQEDNGQGRG